MSEKMFIFSLKEMVKCANCSAEKGQIWQK